MLEDQDPLRHQLEAELMASDWLRTYRAWGDFLNQLKIDVPVTQLCEMKWVTADNILVIHCPNPEIRATLHRQADTIAQLNHVADAVVIKYAAVPDLIIDSAQP